MVRPHTQRAPGCHLVHGCAVPLGVLWEVPVSLHFLSEQTGSGSFEGLAQGSLNDKPELQLDLYAAPHCLEWKERQAVGVRGENDRA